MEVDMENEHMFEEVVESSENEGLNSAESEGKEHDEESDNSEGSEVNDNDKSLANPGWADAMKKVLKTNKPKKKKTIVLSKAKKINEVKVQPKKDVSFEIEGGDEKVKVETSKDIKTETNLKDIQNKAKKKVLGIRKKPSALDRNREKRLQRMATNGVVQLFNAVRKQQKEIEDKLEEAGPREGKRDKALKEISRKKFLDVLMGAKNNESKNENTTEDIQEIKEENNEGDKKCWSVLEDDFGMKANLKDWDKNVSDESDSSAPEEDVDCD
ncbi:hypothetical protein TKK_0001217 [Trichogramma kaykai]|uniref:RRP15-like protein n=1 Tax=Trichogramma kaykai TaxID=54128 RepID=A0ABD2WW79_9HYME